MEAGFYDNMGSWIFKLKYLLYVVFVYLDIEIDIFKVLMSFMLIDTISGAIKVLRINYRMFSFKRLIWGLVSKMGILIIPMVVALLFKGIGQDMGVGTMLIVKILIVSEFISTISNIYTIKTGVEVRDIDIFTMLFKFLRGSALRLLTKYTKIEIDEHKDKNDTA